MKNILLVAAREYKQIASTRGFWVMLLVLPVVIGISQVAGRFFRPQTDSAYVLVDQSDQYEAAIDRRINLNYQRSELSAFSAYVQRWELGGVQPDAVWAKGDRWFTDQQNMLSNRHDRRNENARSNMQTTISTGGKGNIVFVDGHCDAIDRKELFENFRRKLRYCDPFYIE